MLLLKYIVLLAGGVTAALATSCYTCDSNADVRCGDVLNPRHEWLTQCNQGSTPTVIQLIRAVLPEVDEIFTVWPPTGQADCLKTKLKGREIVYRACTNLGEATCSKLRGAVSGTGGDVISCHVCSGDSCNIASFLLAQIFLMFISVIFTKIL